MPQPRATPSPTRPRRLTVAVTGPTGEVGRSLLRALEAEPAVGRVLGMARRPFDPAEFDLAKTVYRQGDVLDRSAVGAVVEKADVVVHLAFVIMGGLEEGRRINLEGSRNVFEATAAARRAKRLVYTSSVAAYGFHAHNPDLLTEDVAPRGTDQHYYSAQKAELERVLAEVMDGSGKDVYVLRPCIVGGPDGLILVKHIPYVQVSGRLPPRVRHLIARVRGVKPLIPDPGVPFQLVHHDDVASALVAAITGKGAPGVYNLAAPGTLSVAELADALGWYSVPIPELMVDATAEVVSRLPFLPAQTQWINTFREPVLMDTAKARRELGWTPAHTAAETLAATIASAREQGVLAS